VICADSLLVQLEATGIRLNCKGKIGKDQFFPKPTLKTKSSEANFDHEQTLNFGLLSVNRLNRLIRKTTMLCVICEIDFRHLKS